jgi:hypothetical protein
MVASPAASQAGIAGVEARLLDRVGHVRMLRLFFPPALVESYQAW